MLKKVMDKMVLEIARKRYVELFGPTVGDKVRLADTDLIIEVEKDLLKYGDELVFGGGKSARDGLGQASGVMREESADLVITNAIILDPVLGIIKADIGIKDGKIAREQDFFDMMSMVSQLTEGDVNADAGNPGVL